LQILNVKSAAKVMEKPDRLNSKNIGTTSKGKTVPLKESVHKENSDIGYWEIEFNGRSGYLRQNIVKEYNKKKGVIPVLA
jgi:phage terminase large subunit